MNRSDLEDIEKIKRLKARYFYYLDHKDWDAWRNEIFMADAIMDVRAENGQHLHGIDAIIESVSKILDGVTTIHHGHMPIIDITSPTTATGLWAMEDVLFWPKGRYAGGIDGRMHGYGHYRETYSKSDGNWRIQTLELTRLHVGPMP